VALPTAKAAAAAAAGSNHHKQVQREQHGPLLSPSFLPPNVNPHPHPNPIPITEILPIAMSQSSWGCDFPEKQPPTIAFACI
jgi:hypothetical protein